MTAPVEQIREDFDQIALLTERLGTADDLYHKYILRQVPDQCEHVLEIGCGTGAFSRLLAGRAKTVLAVDLSPQMIRLASRQSPEFRNIEYVQGDVMQLSLPVERFDCIVSLATVHHLPLHNAMLKMKAALAADGTLIIHDVTADDRPCDKITDLLALPVSIGRRYSKTGKLRLPHDLRKAWESHGKGESYLSMNDVKQMCKEFLPGAEFRRHLLWRYTVVWRKGCPS